MMISIHIWQKPDALSETLPNSTASSTVDADIDSITLPEQNGLELNGKCCTRETHTAKCKLICRAYLGIVIGSVYQSHGMACS